MDQESPPMQSDQASTIPQVAPPPPPKKSNVFLWILFVILLFGSGWRLYLTAQEQGWLPTTMSPTPTPVAIESTSTPNPIEGWTTYTNTKYGYAISMPATVKTQVNAAGAGTQTATPDSNQVFIFEQSAKEPYLERYLEIVPMGQVVDLPVGQWQKTDVMINGIPAARFEDPDPQTFVVYRLAIPNTSGELEIYVTKDTQRVALAKQILSTFKFLDDSESQTYVCPEGKYINCMPIVVPEKQWMCEDTFFNWAKQNCPDFEGPVY